jgi:hypothetical protein
MNAPMFDRCFWREYAVFCALVVFTFMGGAMSAVVVVLVLLSP